MKKLIRCLLISCSLGMVLLSGCANGTSASTTKPQAARSSICLVDPQGATKLVYPMRGNQFQLDQWVVKHREHLNLKGGTKPRFILLFVSSDRKIKDKILIFDQRKPGAPNQLSASAVSSLKDWFAQGETVTVDWATNRVVAK
jgi:hypothetical protein